MNCADEILVELMVDWLVLTINILVVVPDSIVKVTAVENALWSLVMAFTVKPICEAIPESEV
jgi:hypothetical protein